MMTIARLRRKPRHFQSFTGLSVVEFDRLLMELEPAYADHLRQQRESPDRQRAVGGGRGFHLALPDRVLLGLVYLRLYVTQSLLSYLFGLDESNVSRELNHRLLPVLLSVLPAPLTDAPLRTQREQGEGSGQGTPAPPRKKIRTVEELFRAYPELKEVLVDATEQEVPKPKDKADRKGRYSGKQKEHTVKTQVLTTRKQVLHVFGGLPGSLHDLTLLRASGVLRKLPAGIKVRKDRGYDGIDADHPDVEFQSPIKGRRGHTVTALGQAYNRMLNAERIAVEHMLCRLQKFKVLAGVYRGPWRSHEGIFCVVSGLVNYKATGQFQLTGD